MFNMTLLLCCLATVFVSALSQTTDVTTTRRTPRPAPDLISRLNKLGNFGQIISIINSTHRMSEILNADSITLFLPTNDALNKLPAGYLDDLRSDPQRLEDVLNYHMSPESVSRLQNDRVIMSKSNKPIRINTYGALHVTSAEGVAVTQQHIQIANGYVHGIDGFMTPPEGGVVDLVVQRDDLSTLETLLTKAGLVDVIKNDQNITVFAPSDAAFAKLDPRILDYLEYNPDTLKEILLYHVVAKTTMYSIGMRHSMTFNSADGRHDSLMLLENAAGEIFVNHAKVSERDISAFNGVVHVIDDVLIPLRVMLELEGQGFPVIG